jgi:divalent metal cation (Fe/Co/Zn/Cd) transporter
VNQCHYACVLVCVGYGKVETLGSFFVSGLLAAGAVGSFLHSIHVLSDFTSAHPEITSHAHSHFIDTSFGLGVALASVVVKEVMYRWTMKIGMQLNSPILKANAWHHRSGNALPIPISLN